MEVFVPAALNNKIEKIYYVNKIEILGLKICKDFVFSLVKSCSSH